MNAITARPTAQDVQSALDAVRERFALVPDAAWELPAEGLDWTCRETVMHILDDLGSYALQLSGRHGHEGYAPLREFGVRPGRPVGLFWPEEEGGTRAVLDCLDAVGGLLVAVVASAPPDRIGWHPHGRPDRSGLAAMGIVELALHASDILRAQGIAYRAEDDVVTACLDRIFPAAPRTGDPWRDLLAATGRTPETKGRPWRWDCSIRGGG
ncbi:DinB family protein [Rothia sp. AR01]|uniref:DinB family protein n=1 Tax=Rothia santali TaxID=2949643 RepID=A0A9X2HAJ1_9MICC|nr:DinB family protein [Rothia santali]MCP3425766.1 DinB family protein [Rothia santali]